MSRLERFARWICPELALKADTAYFYRNRAEELATWCDGEAQECGRWMLDRAAVHYMSLSKWFESVDDGSFSRLDRRDISDLREDLRRSEKKGP